jgi:hypothetical protein
MASKRSIVRSVSAASLTLVAATVLAAPAAVAGDRPTNVAFVQAWKKVYLHHDGSVTVTAGVRCVPGWEGGELDMRVSQGINNDADGFVEATVTCDNAWHPVRFTLHDVAGAMKVGPAQISSQFIVTNVDSGDSAGAHDQRTGRVLRGHAPLM